MDAELDERFSQPGATATPWEDAVDALSRAERFWISTVRPDGRPHVTPLFAVYDDGIVHFCTGAAEQKGRNLDRNDRCAVSTALGPLEVVVEGEAVRVVDEARLQRLSDAWVAKYGDEWRFDVVDGAFAADGRVALVYEVRADKVLGFDQARGGQTRWRSR